MPNPERTGPGYAVLLPVGLFTGLAGGLALGQPSLGAVLGLGAGGLLAILLQLRS